MKLIALFSLIMACRCFGVEPKRKSKLFDAGRISIKLTKKLKMVEEPISEPYHVLLEIKCDRNKKQVIRRRISVCDTKLEGQLKNGKFHHSYYFWAANLSTTQGVLVCDYGSPVIETIRLRKLCKR